MSSNTDAHAVSTSQAAPVPVKIHHTRRRRLGRVRKPIAVDHPLAAARTVMRTAGISLGICFTVWLYASAAHPAGIDRWMLVVILLGPAVKTMATERPTYLLDWFLILVAINRELRRLLDWGQDQYDPTPILSLLPLVVTLFMVPTILTRWSGLPMAMKKAAGALAAGVVYALVIGLVRNGFPAIYSFSEYATPLIVLLFAITIRPSIAELERWVLVLGTLGVLVGAYGIYQWTAVPPWDAAWLVWSGMGSSMGSSKAFQMSICSTLESRGPAAMFFATTVSMFLCLPMLRRKGGLLLAAVPAIAMLLTQARTALIYAILSLGASIVFARRGGSGNKTLLALCAVGGLTVALLHQQEESTAIFNRVATLSDVEHDGSANIRVGIADHGISIVAQNPIGFGFGSGGNATLISDRQAEAVGDNGYLEILSMLGVPGAAFYGLGLFWIVSLALRNRSFETGNEPTTSLGLGLLIAIVPVLVVTNGLITAHASYMWILLSRHLSAGQKPSGTPTVLDPSALPQTAVRPNRAC